MNKLTLDDLGDDSLRGRRVLVRVDYNVPLDSSGTVTDDTRIRATLPTLNRLTAAGARVILVSHLGRPKGKPVASMSLRPAADRLRELIDSEVAFVDELTGARVEQAVTGLRDGAVLVLENSRFTSDEEANDPALAAALANLADVYVNDAFGSAHRAHATTAGVAEAVRSRGGLAAAGMLMKAELDYLGGALDHPERPFVAILGGAKISGKIDVIRALLPRTDRLLIGGAMANTFLRAMNLETGASLVEPDRVDLAAELLREAGDRLVIPEDVVVARRLEAGEETRTVARDEIPADWMALDIGPRTIERFRDEIARAATIVWNGPVGACEVRPFDAGTTAVAHALVDATERGATTVLGGGDSAAAITELGLQDQVSHVSTGGGASLEFLEGRELPGVVALSERGATEGGR
jgi:phosphoglycerate kinase